MDEQVNHTIERVDSRTGVLSSAEPEESEELDEEDTNNADMNTRFSIMGVESTASSKKSAGGLCGLCCCSPKWLQFFNTPKWFLFFVCLFVVIQSMTISGMNGVVIPTIEKRFQLTSASSGLISGAYDIAAAVLVLPIAYFGERAHKPRWLAIGCALLGVGALVFALPQFITGVYQSENLLKLEQCGAAVNHSLYTSECETDRPGIYGLLIIGQLILGMGALPLYTVGVAFLDEIASPKVVHYYIGLFYVCAALGPAIGFLLGSLFLSQYVDLSVTSYPDASDPNFVGRWWAGYVLAGFLALLVSIPLFMYPKQLPNTAWIMEEKRRKQLGTGKSSASGHPGFGRIATDGVQGTDLLTRAKAALHECLVMCKVIFALLLTPVLLTNTMGATTESFAVSGIVPFITKYFEAQFGATASSASLLTGAASIVGIVGGILFSSWLMKYRNVHGARLAKYTTAIALIAIFFVLAFFVRCPTKDIVGVSRPYPGSTVTGSNRCKLNFTHTCLSECGCVSERYDPVCGSDGYTYPTPCLAGCQTYRNGSSGKDADRVYLNCTCVAPNLASSNSSLWNATATAGSCSSGCSLLPLFMVLLICLMFFTFMNNVPAIEVVLQSVPADRRTLATGVQWIVIRLIGNIPGPVFYGFLLDRGCHLWQLNCCDEGNCWEYDNTHMSNSMFAATMVCKGLSCVFFLCSWRLFVRDDKLKALKKATSELQE